MGLGLWPGIEDTDARITEVLDGRTVAIVDALADRLCPGAQGLPKASSLGVAHKVDHLLASMHPADADEFVQALWLLENALTGLLLDGVVGPFTTLVPAEQDRVLARWRDSRVLIRRKAWKALRGIVSAAYWASPEVFAFSGYPGPPPWLEALRKGANP